MELVANRPRVRQANLARLRDDGFRPVHWFPLREHRAVVRPVEEIARRMAALAALARWTAPGDDTPPMAILAHVARNDLAQCLLVEERAALESDRSPFDAPLIDFVWPLAWTLGFETEPDTLGEPPSQSVSLALDRFAFRGGDVAVADLAGRTRTDAEIVGMEDLFAYAHQTARLATLRHPDAHMPARARPASIEARRHALTWCMSPADDWSSVDLST